MYDASWQSVARNEINLFLKIQITIISDKYENPKA
jgi:hypothetical protein